MRNGNPDTKVYAGEGRLGASYLKEVEAVVVNETEKRGQKRNSGM
jgi:hypothetical protein